MPKHTLDSAHRVSAQTDDPSVKLARKATFDERLADRVARFGGSWTFIMIFVAILKQKPKYWPCTKRLTTYAKINW